MKIIVVGAVAGGTSAAAKARRNNADIEITVYERGNDISYSGCGLPYYIGNKFKRDDLIPRKSKWFKGRFDIDIKTGYEVTAIDPHKKLLEIKCLTDGQIFTDNYDKLVLATGASPFIPPVDGINSNNVFALRTPQSADEIIRFIKEKSPKCAVIVGAGFIGLETAENLCEIGIDVTILEAAHQVMPPLDNDMAVYVEKYLNSQGVKTITGESLVSIQNDGKTVVTLGGKNIPADLIILATGVKPEISLASNAGIKIGETGAISTNKYMQTNIPDIYAVGDCAESFSIITGKSLYVPLGTTANKTGRIAGDIITGGNLEFKGILPTSIFKLFNLAIAQTGLTEKQALKEGFEPVVAHNIKYNQSSYFKESREMIIKTVTDKKSGRIIGAQIIGERGVDKRIDIFATAITFKAKASDLFNLDLAYAPPFSTAKDPVMYSGMITDNILNRNHPLIKPQDLGKIDGLVIIDVRDRADFNKSRVEGAVNIPLAELREKSKTLDKNKPVAVYCNKGVTANAAQNLLLNLGFKSVYNLSGGLKHYFKEIF
jgi:NADPH-dependent 2,4-dienoyl-CoA reductase/sulfur reductase-like enzyme/rhodanese-related sulfurtransferase